MHVIVREAGKRLKFIHGNMEKLQSDIFEDHDLRKSFWKEDESRSFDPIGVCLSSKTPSCLETVTRERFIFSSFDIVIIDHWRPHQHRPNDIYGILKEVLRRREDDHRWHGWTWGRIIGDKHICSNPSTSSHRQLFILVIVVNILWFFKDLILIIGHICQNLATSSHELLQYSSHRASFDPCSCS